jgi:hypothetical protein
MACHYEIHILLLSYHSKYLALEPLSNDNPLDSILRPGESVGLRGSLTLLTDKISFFYSYKSCALSFIQLDGSIECPHGCVEDHPALLLQLPVRIDYSHLIPPSAHVLHRPSSRVHHRHFDHHLHFKPDTTAPSMVVVVVSRSVLAFSLAASCEHLSASLQLVGVDWSFCICPP